MKSIYTEIQVFLDNMYKNIKENKMATKSKCLDLLNKIELEQPNKWHLLLNLCLLRVSDQKDFNHIKSTCEEIEHALADIELKAQLHLTLADLYNRFNKNENAIHHYEICLPLFKESANVIAYTQTRFNLAILLVKIEKYFDAFKLLILLIEDNIIKEDYNRMIIAYKWLAIIEKDLKYNEESIKHCILMGDLSLQKQDMYSYAEAYSMIGSNYSYLNNYDQALKALFISYEVCSQNSFIDLLAITTRNIGFAYMTMQDFDQAEKYYFISIKHEKHINSCKHLADKYLDLGHIYFQKKDYPQAQACLINAMSIKKKHELENLSLIFLCYAELFIEQNKRVLHSQLYFLKKSI
ncbi:MAG TPA: hypothetical protein PKZ69_04215 [Candidatus Cloacimonadota bacterium]|nr:hypothetical protein [Candidatus Cloacimonadota bacterium]HOQ80832.1 hypothetical protein [Candidatus Cloacimonadota bacterium]HPK40806.1 hypothetical protein [Candidatus Cloacimonadota bacterium]